MPERRRWPPDVPKKSPLETKEDKTVFRERLLKMKEGRIYTVKELSEILDLPVDENLIDFLNQHGGWKKLEKGKFQLVEKKGLEKKIDSDEQKFADVLMEIADDFRAPFSSSEIYNQLKSRRKGFNFYLSKAGIHNTLLKLHSQGKLKYYPPFSKKNPEPLFEK